MRSNWSPVVASQRMMYSSIADEPNEEMEARIFSAGEKASNFGFHSRDSWVWYILPVLSSQRKMSSAATMRSLLSGVNIMVFDLIGMAMSVSASKRRIPIVSSSVAKARNFPSGDIVMFRMFCGAGLMSFSFRPTGGPQISAPDEVAHTSIPVSGLKRRSRTGSAGSRTALNWAPLEMSQIVTVLSSDATATYLRSGEKATERTERWRSAKVSYSSIPLSGEPMTASSLEQEAEVFRNRSQAASRAFWLSWLSWLETSGIGCDGVGSKGKGAVSSTRYIIESIDMASDASLAGDSGMFRE